MMHKNRVFRVVDSLRGNPPFTAAELARVLTEHDWCLCNGFRIGHLVFLNDSTGPDGAQEYAVFNETTGTQLESFTVSWMVAAKLKEAIEKLLAGTYEYVDPWGSLPSLAHPEGSCAHCA